MSGTIKSLSFSLFAVRSVWNLVLAEGVRGFLDQNKRLILRFNIEFSYFCGESIRFSVFCESRHAELLSMKTDVFFKAFFREKCFPAKEIVLPVDGIFLPFPANTIQYGLYENPSLSDRLDTIKEAISGIILNTLAEDIIDDESIFTLAIYLHLGLLREVKRLSDVALQNLKFYHGHTDPGEKDLLKENYETNKMIYAEIYSDVFNRRRDTEDEVSLWLNNWIELCSNLIAFDFNDQTDIVPALAIASTIDKLLGVDASRKLVLSNIIQNLMSENISLLNFSHEG